MSSASAATFPVRKVFANGLWLRWSAVRQANSTYHIIITNESLAYLTPLEE